MTKITTEHLARSACVYIRQLTADQLARNHEGRRRQYGLVDRAKQLGKVGPQDTVEARLLRQTWPVRTSLNYFVKLLGERHTSFLDQATGFESANVSQSRL
jgi:hypothetical protein